VGAEIFINFCFFIHNFGYRYARKSFKGSKDTYFGLVSEKILSQNNGSLVGVQGQVKVAKKCKNTPTCGIPPWKRQTENEKLFFQFQLEDLQAESIDGLNSSLALAAGEL